MKTIKWANTAKAIHKAIAPYSDDVIDKDTLMKVLCVTRTFVNALLRGDKSLPANKAEAIADFYNVDFEVFREAYLADVYHSYEPA